MVVAGGCDLSRRSTTLQYLPECAGQDSDHGARREVKAGVESLEDNGETTEIFPHGPDSRACMHVVTNGRSRSAGQVATVVSQGVT